MHACTASFRSRKEKKDANIICTDSKNIVEMADNARAGVLDSRQEFSLIKEMVDKFPNCFLNYINRRWNKQADYLAKQGIERKHLVAGWT